MNIIRRISYVLVIAGAIVLGIAGLFNYNIVTAMFGDATVLSRILYSLIGAGALGMLAIPEEERECYCDTMDATFR